MAIEDFNTYIEADPGNDITVTAPKLDCEDLHARSTESYVYKDFTANHFDALNVLFECQIDSTSTPDYPIVGLGFANVVDDASGFGTTAIWAMLRSGGVGIYRIYFERGNLAAFDWTTISADTIYYCHLERAAGNDAATLKVYDDAERTSLVDTLNLSGFGTAKWRYCYGLLTYNTDTPAPLFDGFIQNLDLQEVVGTNMSVNISDVFKDISEIKINIGDVWKDVAGIKINIGDVWKDVF